jgi:cell division protease FtsH
MILKKAVLMFLPCALSFLAPKPLFKPVVNSQLRLKNGDFDFKQSDYLLKLENITMSSFNVTTRKFKNIGNLTAIVLKRRQTPKQVKKTYIENLIFPIFDDPVEDPEVPEIPELVRVPVRRARKLAPVTKSSKDGNFKIEQLDSAFNFSKIGGYDEVKAEMTQVIDFLIRPENYTKYGVRLPKGLLLAGPPGNGKTLLAKALAGETNTSFISTVGSIFNEKYVGVGSARVRELFDLANDNLPCIIFIDELDAVAKKRSGSGEGADAERDSTLNQLLVGMDGFEGKSPLLVVGATNRIDSLDNAILRPGRFDKVINVPNPDQNTREAIIKIHAEGKPLNISIPELVKLTTGFSGAQIENILNEAVLYGIRNNTLPVDINIFDIIRDRILLGRSTKKRELSEATLKRICFHEIGHLLLILSSKHVEKPEKVSIDSKSNNALGFVMSQQTDIDENLYTKEYLEDKLKVLLAGRLAEQLFIGSISSGCVNDLEVAFGLAKTLVLNYGMGNRIIYPHFSEEYKKKIDENINELINYANKEAEKILQNNRPLINYLAKILLEKKTLSYAEICSSILEFNAIQQNLQKLPDKA